MVRKEIDLSNEILCLAYCEQNESLVNVFKKNWHETLCGSEDFFFFLILQTLSVMNVINSVSLFHKITVERVTVWVESQDVDYCINKISAHSIYNEEH